MKRLLGCVLGLVAVAAVVADTADEGKRWWSYVEMLASDQMQGRNTGSAEHRKAADYVASEFQRAGLKPAGPVNSNGYIQPVSLNGRRIMESQSSLELVRDGKAQPLALGEDAVIALRVDPAESVEA